MRLTVLLMVMACAALVGSARDLGRLSVPLDGHRVAVAECALGNVVADAVRHAACADVAIVHAMAFAPGAMLPAGIVDERLASAALTLATDRIVTMVLTPAQLRGVLQRGVQQAPRPSLAFLQLSGLQVICVPDLGGLRVAEVRLAGSPLDLTDTTTRLTVAMPNQLAKGAVGYVMEFTPDIARTLRNTGISLLEALGQEVARVDNDITAQVEGRLVVRQG